MALCKGESKLTPKVHRLILRSLRVENGLSLIEDRAFRDREYLQEILAVESDLIDEYGLLLLRCDEEMASRAPSPVPPNTVQSFVIKEPQ